MSARERWTELNIGPYFIDTEGDIPAARNSLTQLEQLRWVLGNLLESQDLKSVWPFRILLTKNEGTNPTFQSQFVSQNGEDTTRFVLQNGQYLLVASPNEALPLGEVAGILLDANTPRLPPEVERGIRELFSTLQAQGARVTWGSAPVHPDLAWARMQLFATKFEYSLSFHIFLASLRDGSTLSVAEQNAFGKPARTLEAEAAANLAAGHWESVPVSGRPLDPKRDFGEHSVDGSIMDVYFADAQLAADPEAARKAYNAAVQIGDPHAAALGYAGLAGLAKRQHKPYKPYLDDAMQVGSRSAPVYLEAANGLSGDQAVELLKKAALLNPRWAEPIYRQALITTKPAGREALLRQCTDLDPRKTECWVTLAQLQSEEGHATAAQGSWLRAEQSAPNNLERDRIHQLNTSSEEQRLNAAEAERRRQEQAAQEDDDRALRSEAARIHAAERRANRELANESSSPAPTQVVPWNRLATKKLNGSIVVVGCVDPSSTISVRDSQGKTINLTVQDRAHLGLFCGVQRPPIPVSVTYSEHPDTQSGTAGEVVSLVRR